MGQRDQSWELLDRRLRKLEGWMLDHAGEYREMREDVDEIKPFVEMMMAEEAYRKRRLEDAAHALETSGQRFSKAEKAIAAAVSIGLFALAVANLILDHLP